MIELQLRALEILDSSLSGNVHSVFGLFFIPKKELDPENYLVQHIIFLLTTKDRRRDKENIWIVFK